MYHFNKIIAVAFIILLTGCSIGGEKKIKIFSIEKPREKLDYPMPTPLQMEEITGISSQVKMQKKYLRNLKRQE